jgi:hypothetical protein
LTLTLTENEGFSPEFIYERARLRALSSENELDFNNLTLKNLTLILIYTILQLRSLSSYRLTLVVLSSYRITL